MSTPRLPVCRTSWPGPCPRTSAEGEWTRRNSYGKRKLRPSANAISITRDFWCRVIAVGERASCTAGLWNDFESDAFEVEAAFEHLGEASAHRRVDEQIEHTLGLEPAQSQHQRRRRLQRSHGREAQGRHEFLVLHVQPRWTNGARRWEAEQQPDTGMQVAVVGRHEPAHLPQQ